jgi:hypothetical protein
MKLVDKDGRFQLVLNDIVKIDPELPKYKKLEIVKQAVLVDSITDLVVSAAGEENTTGELLVREGTQYTRYDNDVELRQIIQKLRKDNVIRKLLDSDKATEINETFKKVLQQELNTNKHDLSIGPFQWEAGAIGTPKNTSQITGLLKKVWAKITGKVEETTANMQKKLTVLELFDVLHLKEGQEMDFINRLDGYSKMLDNAERNHQTALCDEIAQKMLVGIYESVLKLNGFDKYIRFSDIEQLQSKCKRVIDIDYISAFARCIPESVTAKKEEADKLCVFDNYCVVYYDPEETVAKRGKSDKKTAQEKRDPILFGLINHSDKLYYIDSWIDELCDLTIDTIAEKIGNDKVQTIE